MTLTFKQAFTQWAAVPENTALAAKSRNAVAKVIIKHYGDNDVCLFNKDYVTKLFMDCKLDKPARVLAASVLCHVLSWLHQKEPSVYAEPDFDLSVNSAGRPDEQKRLEIATAKSRQTDKMAAAVKVMQNEDQRQDGIQQLLTEKKHNTHARPVVQISADDFKEVKRYQSSGAAQRALGIRNVLRAASKHAVSGGYYWAFEDEWNSGWKPLKTASLSQGRKASPKPRKAVKTTTLPALIDKGRVTVPVNTRDFLAAVSDDDLFKEICRRDNWHGTFSFTKSITK